MSETSKNKVKEEPTFDKDTRIYEEFQRISVFFEDLAEHERSVILPLIQNAAFMRVTLEDLQKIIAEQGPVEAYQNGENQYGMKQSAAMQSYNSLIKNYAVEHYDPERGSFTTLLSRYLLRAFQEATAGRSIKQQNDPLLRCRSLDEHVGDEDGDTILLDLVPDERNEIADAEERIFTEQLHNALEAALNAIPEREAAVIRSEFYDGCKQWETAEKLHTTPGRVHQLKKDGLRHIWNSSSRKKLERFLDENTSYYKGMGMSSYKQTNTSGVERWVLRREQMRKTYDKLINEGSHKMEHTTVGSPEDLSNKFDLPVTKRLVENPEQK